MKIEELKAMVGDKAFDAMSEDQRTGLLSKFAKPEDPKPEPKENEKPADDDSKSLFDKAKSKLKGEESEKSEQDNIESAVAFNYTAQNWFKENADLLPREVEDFFKVAEKEKYDSQVDKANALRAAIVQSFFEVQSNIEMLTASQKAAIDGYLKLTKNGKEAKAKTIYENFFEPTLETLKRIRKAEEVGRSKAGFSTGTSVENAYKERLIKGSRQTYLGEKAS